MTNRRGKDSPLGTEEIPNRYFEIPKRYFVLPDNGRQLGWKTRNSPVRSEEIPCEQGK